MKRSCFYVFGILGILNAVTACQYINTPVVRSGHLVMKEELDSPVTCRERKIGDAVEEICDDWFDLDRAHYIIRKQAVALPGHSSGPADFEPPENSEGSTVPWKCIKAIGEVVDTSSRFQEWLRQQRYTMALDSLTTEAAFNVRDMVRTYTMQAERIARAKARYTPVHNPYFGDNNCASYLNDVKAEIDRIVQLVIDELNKGNLDLAGTDLNPYGRPPLEHQE